MERGTLGPLPLAELLVVASVVLADALFPPISGKRGDGETKG